MTLTEFLLARIAEDEALAVESPLSTCDGHRWVETNPARVLAAKRRIVERHAPYAGGSGRPTLVLLASMYADHPDYRDEWRP